MRVGEHRCRVHSLRRRQRHDLRVELRAIRRLVDDIGQLALHATRPVSLPRTFPDAAADAAGWRQSEAVHRDVVVREPRQHRDREHRECHGPARPRRPLGPADQRKQHERHHDNARQEQEERGTAQGRRGRQHAEPGERSWPLLMNRPDEHPHRQREHQGGPDLGQDQRCEVRQRREQRRRTRRGDAEPGTADLSPDREHRQADGDEHADLNGRDRRVRRAEDAVDDCNERRVHGRSKDFGHELRRVGIASELAG